MPSPACSSSFTTGSARRQAMSEQPSASANRAPARCASRSLGRTALQSCACHWTSTPRSELYSPLCAMPFWNRPFAAGDAVFAHTPDPPADAP